MCLISCCTPNQQRNYIQITPHGLRTSREERAAKGNNMMKRDINYYPPRLANDQLCIYWVGLILSFIKKIFFDHPIQKIIPEKSYNEPSLYSKPQNTKHDNIQSDYNIVLRQQYNRDDITKTHAILNVRYVYV